jgi:hypothetical protein
VRRSSFDKETAVADHDPFNLKWNNGALHRGLVAERDPVVRFFEPTPQAASINVLAAHRMPVRQICLV